MSKKLLAICLAVIGFGGLFTAGVSAHEASAPATSLPAVAHINQTVVVETGGGFHRRHWHHRHHRYYGRHYYGRGYHHRHHRYHHYR